MPCTVTVRSVFSIGVTTLAASSDIIILPSLVTGGTITLRTTRNLSCLYDTIPRTQAYQARKQSFSNHRAIAPFMLRLRRNSSFLRCFCGFCGRVPWGQCTRTHCGAAATHPFLDVFVGGRERKWQKRYSTALYRIYLYII